MRRGTFRRLVDPVRSRKLSTNTLALAVKGNVLAEVEYSRLMQFDVVVLVVGVQLGCVLGLLAADGGVDDVGGEIVVALPICNQR